MKTEISRFCSACADTIAPLPDVLDAAAAQFERRPEALGGALAVLNETRALLRSLTDKLQRQQAYLLIFGPLKSGKSTLMNAISGSYVSEVTSLPGYPCLVFVRDNAEARFSVTRYNGLESAFPDKALLADVVTEAHHALAQQIRAAEARGEAFDPRTTFPEAIRRVDIQLPVPALAESATVLVDTPGLYSRMNFGYDVLTREFRDSAACAVFVVKTDNLFLEQVFAEFNQLLGLFSRIFIVVNVDAGKRDLAPDGSLRPSAESEHPERVIEAFTTLSMAGPLREAYEAGRVRIHAVDLQGAAASLLSGEAGGSHNRVSFDAFLQDLTEYLNSSDYTREFIRDSLRQACSLCEEARLIAVGEEVAALATRQKGRASEIASLDARLEATERLLATNWRAMFERFHEESMSSAAESIRTRTGAMREEMRIALERWFGNDESLSALCANHWNEALVNTGRSLFDDVRSHVGRAGSTETAGLAASAQFVADMKVAGFSPVPAASAALNALSPSFDPTPFPARIAVETMPVRKTFVDWLLFRRMAKVRTRLFGEMGTKDIPVAEKGRRLLDPARAALGKHLDAIVSERFPGTLERFAITHTYDFTTTATTAIQRSLRELRDGLVHEYNQLKKPYAVDEGVLAAVARLEQQADDVMSDICLLALQEGVTFNEGISLDAVRESVESSALLWLPPLLVG